MRVLYLTMNPSRTSTTVPTEGWFRLLTKRGLRPVLVSHECGPFHEWCVQHEIPSYQNPLPFPSKANILGFLLALWQLWRIVKRHHIQLIHCNEQDVYPIGRCLGRLCRLPTVVSVHCMMSRPFCEWAFRGKRCPDRIFFVSRGSQEACRPVVEGIIPEDRWCVLYNGLDLQYFKPDAELRRAFRSGKKIDDSIVIGVACALRAVKQLEHFFAAAEKIRDDRLRVMVAGAPFTGEEAYGENLRAVAKEKLGESLSLLGHIEDLRPFYNGLDIFVNTSRGEACSISVIESLSCGCPVVGYPSTSVDDQILPLGGEIVEQGNVNALAEALNRWIKDPNLGSTKRGSARTQAERKFDIHQLSDELWAEYGKIVSSS